MIAFIEIHCSRCKKVIGEASGDFLGLVRLKCRHCKVLNTISLAAILKELSNEKPAILRPRAPAQ